MGIFNHFPYTNFHEINLDWIISKIKELWLGVGDLDDKIDNFIAETEPAIRDQVDKWLDEHPEATTTVQDGSLTLPKFSEQLKEDVILNDEVGIHKRKITFINDVKYCPDDHVCNGFTGDEGFFYIAHHVADDQPLFITKVNKSDLSSVTFQTSLTGHGNSLSVLNDYLYITDSNTGNVDVVNKNNPALIIGSFRPDPYINGFSIKNINNRIISCGSNQGNNLVTINHVVNGYSTLIGRLKLEEKQQSYTQGIDHTANCIYYSCSYGQIINKWWNLPTIDAYSYNGKLLNRVYLIPANTVDARDIEIEDIYRDSENEMLYYVTASGRIGYIETVDFTTSQTNHNLDGSVLRTGDFYSLVNANNEDPQITWYNDTQLAETIRKNPFATIFQGFGIGIGLIGGANAIFFFRGTNVTGFTVSSSIINAYVNYSYDNTNNVLTYQSGGVYTRNSDNTVRIQNLQEWSAENPTRRTTINSFAMIPLSIPFTSNNPLIPIS